MYFVFPLISHLENKLTSKSATALGKVLANNSSLQYFEVKGLLHIIDLTLLTSVLENRFSNAHLLLNQSLHFLGLSS